MPNGIIKLTLLVLFIFGVAAIIFFPVPVWLAEALAVLNLVFAVFILFSLLYYPKRGFTLLPACILVLAIFSIAIQIAFARLILTKGEGFDGQIIRSISRFTMGSGIEGLVVGFIIFYVCYALMSLGICKGATRVSEVAARFVLDGFQVKTMLIDAEYNSGIINRDEVVARKDKLLDELFFYGDLDRVTKYLQGNLKAGLLITITSIIGGIVLSRCIILNSNTIPEGFMLSFAVHTESLNNAIKIYLPLIMGNNFLALFPFLFIAVGIVATQMITKKVI